MKRYPTIGGFSFECSSGGHGRCMATREICECYCHCQTVDTVRENYERVLTKFFDVAMGADSFDEPHAYHNHDSRFEEPRSLPADFPERSANDDEPGWQFCPKCLGRCGGYCSGN